MSEEYSNDDRRRGSIRPDRPEDGPRRQSAAPSRDEPDYYDDAPPRSGGGGGAIKVLLIIFVAFAVVGLLVVGLCGVGGFFLFRSVNRSVASAAARVKGFNNYKQVALAMHNYHDRNGKFPPASMKTKSGKPGLSWRVALLPYLDHDSLYRQFKIDEAWDHPDNRRLASQMPMVFRDLDGGPGEMTRMRGFYGKGAIFDPMKQRGITDITDGSTNTIMFAEAATPVLWIQPDELQFDPKGTLPPLGSPGNDYFVVAMCDGSVRPVKKTTPAEKLRAAITADGGEFSFLE